MEKQTQFWPPDQIIQFPVRTTASGPLSDGLHNDSLGEIR
jgi:hypothetical protein